MSKFYMGQPVQIIRWQRSTVRIATLGEPHGGFLEETSAAGRIRTYWGGKIREVCNVQGATVYTLGGVAKFRRNKIPTVGDLRRAQFYEDELAGVGELGFCRDKPKPAS